MVNTFFTSFVILLLITASIQVGYGAVKFSKEADCQPDQLSLRQAEEPDKGFIDEKITWKHSTSLNVIPFLKRRKEYKAGNTTTPFMVLITIQTDKKIYTCTGTILDSRRVLTAAHCFFDRENKRDILDAYLVPSSLRGQGRSGVNLIQQVFIHNKFDGISLENDIAIVTTLTPFTEGESMKVEIPDEFTKEQQKEFKQNVSIASYGVQEISKNRILEDIGFTLKDFQSCKKRFTNEVRETIKELEVMCAVIRQFDDNGEDVCYGDSGSALFYTKEVEGKVQMFQIGIGSFTEPKCGIRGTTSWFTNLSKYAAAIKENRLEDCTQWNEIYKIAATCTNVDDDASQRTE